MKLQDVNEVVDKLLETYEGAKANNLEGYVQVIWNPDEEHYFRITFEKEKSGGYIADVFYKTFLGNVRTKINKRIELEACMSLEKGGTDMKEKFKVGDKVETKYGKGIIVHITKVGYPPYLVKIEGFRGHNGNAVGGYINVDGLSDKYYFDEKDLVLINSISSAKIILNNPATVINWDNGQKTVVKCDGRDTYDELFGIALAALKYTFGNDEAASKKAYELLTSTLPKSKEFKIPDTIMKKFKEGKLAITVGNQEEWTTLMKYLEKVGFTWNSGHKPTEYAQTYDTRMRGVSSSYPNRFGMTSGKSSKEKITFKQIKGGLK